MSHLTTVQTQFRDVDALRSAVESFGLKLTEGGNVRFFSGKPSVDYLITFPGSYDVGFKVNADGSLSMVCDSELYKPVIYNGKESEPYKLWHDATGAAGNFDKLTDAYSAAVITDTYQRQGFSVYRETREDGSIHVTAQRG